MAASSRLKPRIGIFLRGGDYTYQNEIILGAHEECQAQGVDLYCFAGGLVTTSDPRNVVYDLCGPADLDGVILVPGTMASEDTTEIDQLFRRFHGAPLCAIGAPRAGVNSLGVDNTSGVRELTRHLVDRHGRRRIAFITGPNNEARARFEGYRLAVLESGLGIDESLIVAGDFTPPSGARAVSVLFDEAGGCDAIVAANDWMALGAQSALEARGLRVPEDVALIGFDDIEQARFVTPPLTTVRQPPRQLGIRAVRRVLGMRDQAEECSHVLLPTVAVVRESCGCVGPKPNLNLDVPSPGQSLLSALGHNRDLWIAAVTAAAPLFDHGAEDEDVDTNFAARMVDALLTDLQRSTEHHFVMAVEGIVRQSSGSCNIAAWHRTISRLRAESVTCLSGSARAWLRAETVFERAQVLVSGLAERAQAQRRLEKEALIRNLEELSVAVRTALDVPSLRAAVANHLPHLRVSSLYVVTHPGRPGPDDFSEVLLAYDDESQLKEKGNERPFRTGDIIPADLRPPWRHSVMVEPLFFDEQPLGYCVIEIGARDGSAFKTIPELISTALKAIHLARTIALEATLRERAEKSRLLQELEIAARIQTAILPSEHPVPGLEIATSMLPATEVGGDYFDILPCEDGCWLGIGDVAGHGLHSGLVMLMIQSIVAATTHAAPNAAPAEAWAAMNSVLYENVRRRLRSDEHATLTLLRYRKDGLLHFAGAHEELIVYRARQKSCERLPTPGIWAGILPVVPAGSLPGGSIQLEAGDVLLLYTDGLIEARNAQKGQYGMDRLCASLVEVGEYSVELIRDHLMDQVRAWATRQRDDLTLVVLRYQGAV